MKLFLEETRSTNTWLMEHCRPGASLPDGVATEGKLPNLFTVWAGAQTAGRGQQGNGWESEPGKNLSFSTLFYVDSIEQASRLNMLVPLAVANVLGRYLEVRIKWPNDIYWEDKKLCGLLNENVIIGQKIAYSVAGIGINVNQMEFRSGAPNPISMAQISGHDYVLEELLDEILTEMKHLLPLLQDYASLKKAYMAQLYRKEGFHSYVEREVSTTPTMNAGVTEQGIFEAEIADVDDFGRLVLRLKNGELRTYHFKQIRYVL